ncbi:MAG: TIGR02530 family flagellar biosynthesis protein [Rhodothermales bacterium]
MTVRDLAARVDPGILSPERGVTQAQESRGTAFAEQLRRAREQAPSGGFTLSAHAQQRIEQRGISLNPAEQQSLNDALFQLESKGARDALLLRSDAAFIVNVPSRTVVTAVDTNELKDRVFTQIDSAIMLE